MSCHDNNATKSNGNAHKGHFLHMILMALCCIIPLVLLAVLPFLKIGNTALSSTLRGAALLICPLMMVFMMLPAFGNKKNDGGQHS